MKIIASVCKEEIFALVQLHYGKEIGSGGRRGRRGGRGRNGRVRVRGEDEEEEEN